MSFKQKILKRLRVLVSELHLTLKHLDKDVTGGIPGASCIKKLLKLTMISKKINQSEPRILYLITI